MKYCPQTENACVAFAMMQIGMITKKDAKDYIAMMADGSNLKWDNQRAWVARYFPDYVKELDELNEKAKKFGVGAAFKASEVPKTGKGVLTIRMQGMFGAVWHHAISYEDGLVMDPSSDGPGTPETWEEYKARNVGKSPVIISAVEWKP